MDNGVFYVSLVLMFIFIGASAWIGVRLKHIVPGAFFGFVMAGIVSTLAPVVTGYYGFFWILYDMFAIFGCVMAGAVGGLKGTYE